MTPARLLPVLLALAAQGLLGYGIGFFLGGPVPAGIVACVAAIASIGIVLTARPTQVSAFRQFVLAWILIALHMAALYTLGDDGTTPLLGANAQLVLAGLGLAGCTGFAARRRAQHTMIAPIEPPAPAVDDEDSTIEIPPAPLAPPAARVDPAPLETIPPPRLRGPLALGVLSCALLVMAAMFWLGNDPARNGLGGAVASELPAPSAQVDDPAGADSAPAAQPATADTAAPVYETATASSAGSAMVKDNALAPSAARRECMAQIESARLFLQIARQSGSEAQYSHTRDAQIQRMLKQRPVGPRTLGRIAERMWEQRAQPERNSAWWSSQFTRCEAARSGGSWYVVKG